MKNVIGLIKLTLETGGTLEEVCADIPQYCMDEYDLCGSEELMRWDDTEENRIIAREELAKHENEAHEVGKCVLATAHVLEFYKADDNGEFVESSDYDW